MPAKHLTVRNIPPDLSRALEREKRRRGASLNQTVIELLGQGLGVGSAEARSNGLRRLAGTWSEEQRAEFEATLAAAEDIDAEVWR
jgi:hypothetical protein